MEEPDTTPDKPKRQKIKSPPPQQGPSARRQAANKNKRDNQGKPAHLYPQLEIDKLPDLVVNSNKLSEFTGVMSTPDINNDQQSKSLVTPETTNIGIDESVFNSVPLSLPAGHDTATTTDEEEAAEALLTLGNALINDDFVQEEDNATLMPIGKANTTVDINPVPVRLSANDVNIAIQNIPDENKLEPTARVPTDPTCSTAENKSTRDMDDEEIMEPIPTNEDTKQKGQLKLKVYGLKKLKQSKKCTYRCQKCGKKETSVHDLNEHHRANHPPLLCMECNRVIRVPSTFQVHQYEHQKQEKIPRNTCGHLFSFQGQLEQHKIVHRTIRTHKCMYSGCDRWFMQKADLVVHTESHNNVEYKCEICNSFTTKVKKYWKEHVRSHENKLRYSCPTCGKKFQYRQQVSRHRAQEHK